jgi:hypothetical protein
MQFTTKNSLKIDLYFSYANKLISKAYKTKFLGIYVGSALSCKNHIEQITHKLSAVSYAMRSVKRLTIMSQEKLKLIYYVYFHSIINYGLIFLGNSSYGAKILKIHNNTIRIITGCRSRDLCKYLFINL